MARMLRFELWFQAFQVVRQELLLPRRSLRLGLLRGGQGPHLHPEAAQQAQRGRGLPRPRPQDVERAQAGLVTGNFCT